jgi:hypothetical protein
MFTCKITCNYLVANISQPSSLQRRYWSTAQSDKDNLEGAKGWKSGQGPKPPWPTPGADLTNTPQFTAFCGFPIFLIMDQDGSTWHNIRPKTRASWPNIAPRWPNLGRKLAPHGPKIGQHSPKMGQHSSKTGQHSPQDGSKLVEEVPTYCSRKLGQPRPKMRLLQTWSSFTLKWAPGRLSGVSP